LRGINRHVALRLRQRTRAKEKRLETAQVNALQAPKTTTLSTSAIKALDRVLRAVDSLPTQYREVLVLRYWEKLSNEEIANRLGIPLGTVGSRMARANSILAEKLKAFLGQENKK
jgi:RNA polymerase sigma-70 factor, ECF subfamily